MKEEEKLRELIEKKKEERYEKWSKKWEEMADQVRGWNPKKEIR